MKKMKTKSILSIGIIFLSLLLVINFVSASCPTGCTVNTFLKYENAPTETTKTVTQGDNINLVLVAYSHGETLSLERLSANSTLILQENQLGIEQTTLTYLYNKVYSLDTSKLNPGSYTLKFMANSQSGVSDFSGLTITILEKIISDTTSPIVNILSPSNGATYTSNRTQMVATITDDSLSQCWYDLGAGNISFSCSNGTNTINSILSKQGSNTWKVYAKDLAGNVGSDTVTFTVKSSTKTTGCTSCNSYDNGPLNETILDNTRNNPGSFPTEEFIKLNVKSEKLNIFEIIFLWVKNLLGL